MIPSPILKALSSIHKHQVQALLMGGQACVFYGAAEFSRDTDFAILAEPANLEKLQTALDELRAPVIAVPPFSQEYLRKGHAVHFRCQHPDVKGLRIDIMSKMRGVDPFDQLWGRRTTITDDGGNPVELMSLPDLVRAKKTQRDKDWPMIRRLIEAHYFEHRSRSTTEDVRFWLLELRTPEILKELAGQHPEMIETLAQRRPVLKPALTGDTQAIQRDLDLEERTERELDREYWAPLKSELETLRHQATRK